MRQNGEYSNVADVMGTVYLLLKDFIKKPFEITQEKDSVKKTNIITKRNVQIINTGAAVHFSLYNNLEFVYQYNDSISLSGNNITIKTSTVTATLSTILFH